MSSDCVNLLMWHTQLAFLFLLPRQDVIRRKQYYRGKPKSTEMAKEQNHKNMYDITIIKNKI